MVCEHVYMNISTPPPNYRACYGPVIERQMRQIHRQVVKIPLATSLQVFQARNMLKVCRATRCKALRQVASVKKAPKSPPLDLNQRHKTKRIEWAQKYNKVDFSRVIFTDECRVLRWMVRTVGLGAGFHQITFLPSEWPVSKARSHVLGGNHW